MLYAFRYAMAFGISVFGNWKSFILAVVDGIK
jgi:hypothetical protein